MRRNFILRRPSAGAAAYFTFLQKFLFLASKISPAFILSVLTLILHQNRGFNARRESMRRNFIKITIFLRKISFNFYFLLDFEVCYWYNTL